MITTESFKVGDWLVQPELNRISSGSERRGLRPKVMGLLVYLANNQGKVVSGEELLDHLWPDTSVTGGSVYRCIGELRDAFMRTGDDSVYVETIPKKGYRLVAPVKRIGDDDDTRLPTISLRRLFPAVAVVVVVIAIALWVWVRLGDESPFLDPDRPSIAVMPFVNMGEGADYDYFSDGLSEELINLLAQMPELRVISRSSSFSFKGKDISVPEIARIIGADLIMEGSVRKEGNRVRVMAQLIEASSDAHIWSQGFDQSIDDTFRVQDEVAKAVAVALRDSLGLRIESQPRSFASTNPEAQDAYLRGKFLLEQRSTNAIENAVREFETAVMLDPDFALGYAQLAIATVMLTHGEYGDLPASETIASAEPLTARAMMLEPALPEAHMSAAYLELWKGRAEVALPYIERAIQLSPNHALAHSWLGETYQLLGLYQAYYNATLTSLSLDPLSVPTLFNHITSLVDRNRLSEASGELEKLQSVSPFTAASLRGEIASTGGRWADAVFARLDALKLNPEHVSTRVGLASRLAILGLEQEAITATEHHSHYGLSFVGNTEAAVKRAEELFADSPADVFSKYNLALALAGAGDYAGARPLLEQVWERFGRRLSRNGLGLRIDIAAAVIAARLDADEGADISDVVGAILDNVRRAREAGMSLTRQFYSIDFDEGYAAYISGEREYGMQLIESAATEGFFIPPAEAYYAVLRDDPRFGKILEQQFARQQRERSRFLAVVCAANPYAGVWEPASGTCERFAAVSKK